MAYTTQVLIEAYLGRDLTTSEEALLSILLGAIDEFINNQVGGSFGTGATETRYYDGGSRILDIDPCINVTSVSLVFNDETVDEEYVLDEDFEARPINEDLKKWIESRVGKFPHGVANIAVSATFTNGTTVPNDIQYLATYLASQMFLSNTVGNLKSEDIEGYSRTFKDFASNDSTASFIINKYQQDEVFI